MSARQTVSLWALVAVLACGSIAGGAVWYMERAVGEAERALQRFEIPRRGGQGVVIYGRRGHITAQQEGQWTVVGEGGRASGSPRIFTITFGDNTVWLKLQIQKQLPRDREGRLVHDDSITVAPITQDRFQVGDEIYVVARENIAGKNKFEVFKVYRMVYE